MNRILDQARTVRIANFTDIDFKRDEFINFDSEPTESIVKTLRTYADLPYVYIVSKKRAGLIPGLLSQLEAIRSPCYPYALFIMEDAEVDMDDTSLNIVRVDSTDAEKIKDRIIEYAAARLDFEKAKLQLNNPNRLPETVDVIIVGAGITGLYAANRLSESGISYSVLEKQDMVGGIWSRYANSSSQVNSSEGAYRLFEKQKRSNRDHSYTREILEDISVLTRKVSDHLFLETEVKEIEKKGDRYQVRYERGGTLSVVESKGIILAINDRVGTPNDIEWENQAAFQGEIVSGISDGARGIDWRNKDVVIVGMGAFAVENARTALEGGARHVTVVCRRHGTVCPKIIDYLNFATPYDESYTHDNKSNIRNMMYWKKLYQLSGATQPECWMGKIKHEGHTISVSDIWFIGHYLKKIETVQGEITGMTESGVVLDGQRHVNADVVVNCIGFQRNAPLITTLSGYYEMYNNNYVDKDFMYLADAFIDDDAFNSLFGSSVLEMVKFYMEVFVMFFDNPDYNTMVETEGIRKIPVSSRAWSHYIEAAMALIRAYPAVRDTAAHQVDTRTKNFLEIHDMETFIAENKREWVDIHSTLAGKPMAEGDCLPYIFEKLLPKN